KISSKNALTEQLFRAMASIDWTLPIPLITSWSPNRVVVTDYGVTNSDVVVLSGTAAANYTVNVFDNGVQIGTATASSTGAWSFTTPALSDGINAFTVSGTNAAGHTSAPSSNPMHVVVEAHPPSSTPLVGGAQIGMMMEGAEASWTGFPTG